MSQTQTQRQKILAVLRHAGSVGVHTAEIRKMFVANPSQRINELRTAGYVIDSDRERSPFGQSRGTRYFLRDEPTPAPAGAQAEVEPDPAPIAAVPDEAPRLFDLPVSRRSFEDAA